MNFCLKDESIEFKIPEESQVFERNVWSLDSMQQLKCQLNSAKNRLNAIPLNEWSAHTSATDKSSLVIDTLNRQLTRKPFLLTKAWIKFYEILTDFHLIQSQIEDKSRLKVLLLCECPGSFINAINHYIKSNAYDISLDWIANTLNPYYEDIDYTIIDDIFIKTPHLFHNWFFGSTNTGNILDKNFAMDLKHEMKCRNIEDFSLITCDGSINCVDCPEIQEEVVQPLIAKEIMISLQVLANGGCLVVKCFTFFECQMLCLLYLLNCSFKRIHAFKPNASKSGNSEIYLICIGFERTAELNSMLSKTSNACQTNPLFSLQSIPIPFFDKVEECLKYFIKNQISVIENNLQTFRSMTDQMRQQIHNRNKKFAKSLIKRLNIFSISPFEELVNKYEESLANCLKIKSLNKLLTNSKSFDERKQNEFFNNDWFKRLNKLLAQIDDNLSLKNQLIESNYWKKSLDKNLFEIKPIYGLTYNQILNSKFCDLSLIISYNKCMKYKEKFAHIGKSGLSFSDETKAAIERLVSNFECDKSINDCNSYTICGQKTDRFVTQISSLLKSECFLDIKCFTESEAKPIVTENTKIFVINAFANFELELIEEKNALIELISELLQINRFIGEKDLLIIQIGLSLTRLMTATLYLISKSFRNYSLVPCVGGDHHNRHGLIGLFRSRTVDHKQFGRRLDDELRKLLDHLIQSNATQSLVEIICVPLLISGIITRNISLVVNLNVCLFSLPLRPLSSRVQVLRDFIQRKLYSNVGINQNYVKPNNQVNNQFVANFSLKRK